MDIDSGEREIVAELPGKDGYDKIVINGDYLYAFVEAKEAELSENGRARYITGDFASSTLFDIAGNTIYMKLYGTGGISHLAVDINTLEQTELSDDWFSYRAPYDGDSFYYYDNVSYELGIMNIDGTIEKRFLKGKRGEHSEPFRSIIQMMDLFINASLTMVMSLVVLTLWMLRQVK